MKVFDYIPEQAIPILKSWFQPYSFTIKITKKRSSKLGDFRAGNLFDRPQISVNGNLNPYSFLITLTHEFAHLMIHKKHKRRVKPHGKEWKNQFSELLNELLQKNIFPKDIHEILENHSKNPAASSVRDVELMKVLNQYNPPSNTIYLNELPQGAIFSINQKRKFVKGEKRRTRFLCTDVHSKKQYLVHGIAEVHQHDC